MSAHRVVGRRMFLMVGAAAGAGLIVGCRVEHAASPSASDRAARGGAAATKPVPPAAAVVFKPNAWVRVATDGTVIIVVDKAEMGQGVETSLPMLVADELEADWSKVRTEFAGVDPAYKNAFIGIQVTGGSTSIRSSWQAMRKAGAAARMMLVAAAAKEWGVDAKDCRAQNGEVLHAASGRKLGYGALAEKAAAMPLPSDPPLKAKNELRIVGTRTTRLDAKDKASGRTQFSIDVQRTGMGVAIVVRPRVFGAKLRTFDPAKAMTAKGVRKIFAIDSGVAIVADGYWQARQAEKLLAVEWDEGKLAEKSSATLTEEARALSKRAGKVAETKGDVEKAFASAATTIDAVYELPYQAHAPMEPLSCTVELRADGADLWVGSQFPDGHQKTCAEITGLPAASIRVHNTFMGGGFGRRFEQDFVAEAVQIAKAVKQPVKLVWSREDDVRHDYYRPASYNVMRGALGKDGAIVAWSHRIVGPSIMTRLFPDEVKDGVDQSSVEGAVKLAYDRPNVLVDYHLHDTGIPVGFWRSVGHSQNAFVTESFFDELAAAGKHDPFELRRKIMNEPRLKAAMELAAQKAGWGTPMPAGQGRGIAAHASFGSFVAQVAEVAVDGEGRVKVTRVVCAIDCGQTVNPDTIEAQMEGAIAFGLTAALKTEITIERGRVKQGNFHDYPVLAMNEMPKVEVYIVPSDEKPGGVGEPGTPPVAPAVANAIFAATKVRVRSLPIRAAREEKKGRT